ncbi:hypothetical protein NQ318_004027 [Aromia moschata]|uniref:Uncharacterized protein n=1 Tax=Aromia moschata TaxID=1265417 RepID=A0AAV8Z9I9_9CUCU|nr:hypothetical protein NQ318_004027 [Aromia moschata]
MRPTSWGISGHLENDLRPARSTATTGYNQHQRVGGHLEDDGLTSCEINDLRPVRSTATSDYNQHRGDAINIEGSLRHLRDGAEEKSATTTVGLETDRRQLVMTQRKHWMHWEWDAPRGQQPINAEAGLATVQGQCRHAILGRRSTNFKGWNDFSKALDRRWDMARQFQGIGGGSLVRIIRLMAVLECDSGSPAEAAATSG